MGRIQLFIYNRGTSGRDFKYAGPMGFITNNTKGADNVFLLYIVWRR